MPSTTRTKLWNADVKREYWREKKAAQERAEADHSGKAIAENIDVKLAELAPDEHDFIEYLVLINSRTIIAKYDADVRKRLVAREFLQLRPGVGTMLMQDYQTSFSVPTSIWKALHSGRETAFGSKGQSAGDRKLELKKRLGDSLDGVTAIGLDTFDA